MNSKIIYINLQQALELHDWLIENAGGNRTFDSSYMRSGIPWDNGVNSRTDKPHNDMRSGIPLRDNGLSRKTQEDNYLENILQQIQNDDIYPEFKHKLIQLVFAISNSREAIEDNKRLSIALGCYFLELNGYDYVVTYFAEEMENIVVWLEKEKIDRELLAEIIESSIYEDYFSEELKLKIAIAVS